MKRKQFFQRTQRLLIPSLVLGSSEWPSDEEGSTGSLFGHGLQVGVATQLFEIPVQLTVDSIHRSQI